MSGRGTTASPKLEVELNLSPPIRPNSPDDGVWTWNSGSEMSSEIIEGGSCVSSEAEESIISGGVIGGPQPMELVGCRRCLMYVMLSEVDPKCPKCNTRLDFLSIN